MKLTCVYAIHPIFLSWAIATLPALPLSAQIVPDATLAEPSIVESGCAVCTIDGGTLRGTNLFHSFREFSIPTGGEVFFNNGLAIENIFSRVTGDSISNIDGLMRANGTANLFLLNPNGILFGPNAQLEIGGSFLGSTADAIGFGDNQFYSASNPEAPPLLTVNPSALFFDRASTGAIEVRSVAPAGVDLSDNSLSGLRVPDGRSLVLAGGEISIEGGRLNALDGRIELGGLADVGRVELNLDGGNPSLDFAQGNLFADISMTDSALANTSGEGGGEIRVWGRRIELREGSILDANTLGLGNGGRVTLTASESVEVIGRSADGESPSGIFALTGGMGNAGRLLISTGTLLVRDGATIGAATFGDGAGGSIQINASESVQVIGESADGNFGSGIFTQTQGSGNTGDIDIATGRLLVSGGAEITTGTTRASGNAGNLNATASESVEVIGRSADGMFPSALRTNTSGAGNAGNLTVTTPFLRVEDGANIATGTRGEGRGGNLTANVSGEIQLNGRLSDNRQGTVLSTATEGSGAAGDLEIRTPRLFVRGGAQILTSSISDGPAGKLTITATELIHLVGISADNFSASAIATETRGTGAAGNLTVTAPVLLLQDGGLLSSSTRGEGAAGDLIINASQRVQVEGVAADVRFRSRLTSETQGTGAAGDLVVTTPRFSVRDGARVLASTSGGVGGNIAIAANTVDAIDGGQLRTTTTSEASAGDIRLDAIDTLHLAGRNSGLFANTEPESSGNGGSIEVNSATVTIEDRATIAVDSQGTGIGGTIDLTADSLNLENEASILAETASTDGGNVQVRIGDLLFLSHDSRISTTAGTAQAGGNGGDIAIATPDGFIVARQNSDIIANAFSGQGGNIEITAQSLFGIQPRNRLTDRSDITATSQLNTDGEINIDTPDIDPTQGLASLPEAPGVPETAQGCDTGDGTGQFVNSGRGGLPTVPMEPLESNDILDDIQPPQGWENRESGAVDESDRLVEATGWTVDDRGRVVLVAENRVVRPDGCRR